MSTIPITINAAGDSISSSVTNSDFAYFTSVTQDLAGDNTRTEWCARPHIVNPAADPVFNGNFAMVEDSDSTQVVNWNAFQQINLVPAFRVTYGTLTIEPGQVLRAHLDMNVLAATNASVTSTLATNDDVYQFRFYYRDAVSGVVAPIGPTASYSLTNQWNIAAPAPGYTRTPTFRIRQRCNLSLCYINTSNSNLVIDYIEARVRIANLAVLTSITIGEGDFTVLKGNH